MYARWPDLAHGTYVRIFVHSKTTKIQWLVVNEDAGVGPRHSTDTNLLVIGVYEVTTRPNKRSLKTMVKIYFYFFILNCINGFIIFYFITFMVYKYPGSGCIKYGHQKLALPISSNPAQSCAAPTCVSFLSNNWTKHIMFLDSDPLYVTL